MASLQAPFFDLFLALREKMALSPEDYDLLRQSLQHGFGLENFGPEDLNREYQDSQQKQRWSDLQQICRVLWVKPSQNFSARTFEEIFDQYVADKEREIRAAQQAAQPVPKPPKDPPSPKPQRRLPQVPPRKMPVSEPPEPPEQKTPAGAQARKPALPPVNTEGLHLTPTDLPLTTRALLDSWRYLRRPLRENTRRELDLEATLRCIGREGFFSDVVMRPALSRKAELLVLVDDSNGMLPYRPALQPLVDAIDQRLINPAQLYRFTTYPDDYLYDWRSPTQAIPLDTVRSRLHPQRTIVVVWSDAGATQASPLPDQRTGLQTFVTQLKPSVRSLIWLNPVPAYRWEGTLAAEVNGLLGGNMIHPDGVQLLALAKRSMLDLALRAA